MWDYIRGTSENWSYESSFFRNLPVPFSVPFNKRDGTWCVCVCARSVNQARFIKRRFVKLDPAKDLGTCATHALSALVSSSIGWAKRVQHPSVASLWRDSKRVYHPACRTTVPPCSTNTPFDKFALETCAAAARQAPPDTYTYRCIVFAMERRSGSGEYC